MDLPDVLPLFPLPGALLLPRARLPLHLFEPRYLALLDDCLKTDHRLIGMIQPRAAAEGRASGLQSIGCAGRLTGFSETEDGRYMISLTGISRFRLRETVEGFQPYLRGAVSWTGFESDRGGAETDPGFDRPAFLNLLARYFARHNLSTDWESLGQAEDELLINSMAMLAPFEVEDKQALLEAPRLASRRETLMTLIEFALHSDGHSEETRQ
jgi:Lon protease-like protein